MSSSESTILRKRLARMIARRAGSTTDAEAVVAASRFTYDELAAVLAPLISAAGVQALLGRAFDLVQREYPTDWRSGDDVPPDEPFAQMSLWLELHVPPAGTDAAAAMFATFAQLLAALIGEPLTTRYLEKAWPDGFSDAPPTRKKT